ncbi:MAG: hypothetical protein ABSB74_17985 [Tepidisphaeraceae bacterium]
MAKGKRTVALFEVINKDKRMEPKAPAAIKPAKSFSRAMAAQAVDLWRRRRADPETLGPPLPRGNGMLMPRLRAMWQRWTARLLAAGGTARQWMDRQLGALIGSGAAVAVIAAMLLVRHFSTRPAQNLSIEQQLHDGPAHPAVLVAPGEKAGTFSPELAADVIQAKAGVVPDAVAKPGARIVNMHYVLIQSYADEKTANEARDFLNQNGIACTIERGVKGWRMDFYQVIGLQGFVHPSGAEYLAYRSRIKELGLEFSPNVRSYRHFQPQAIKW